MLDGVPVYNPNHFFGFFSIFNDNAIQDITLYKGDFPAQYGGCLSSVLDIRTKDGNSNHFAGSGSAGLLAASVDLEGPIMNDKTTFFVSGRQSYLDLIAAPIIKDFSSYSSANYNFYDINAKLTSRFNNRNKLCLSFYRSHDSGQAISSDISTFFNEQESESWGNTLGSLTWDRVFSSKLFMNMIIHYSKYDYASTNSYGQSANSGYAQTQNNFQSTIYDEGINTNFTWFASSSFNARAGASFTWQEYLPGVESYFNTNITSTGVPVTVDNTLGNMLSKSNQFDLYSQGDIHVTHGLTLHSGLRYTLYKNNIVFRDLEPRFNLEYYNGKGRISLSYTMAHQYNHLISTAQISQATDLWVPLPRE